MLVDIALASIFVVSFGIFGFSVAQKLPQLYSIPDEVITERIEQSSARFRKVFLRLHKLYHEKRLRHGLLVFWGRTLYRLHIIFMRLDNIVMDRLQDIRKRTGLTINGSGRNDNSTPLS
jgi:hypothetical protein